MDYAFAPPAQPTVNITGSTQGFPVHRIYCVGRNYAEHAREMGDSGREPPFFFLKPADTVLPAAAGQTVVMPYPSLTHNLHHEIELVVAIGPQGIFGYAVGLDMTRRDLQNDMKKQGRPWCIGKGFEASAPIGPITPVAQAGDVARAGIYLQVNGEDRQRSNISQLIWNTTETLEQLAQAWTLQPGDLIFTGTPAGVGAVQPGDTLVGGIDGLEPLSVRIR